MSALDLQPEEMWGEITSQLEGYVKVRTNKGFIKVPLKAPYQDDLAEEAKKMKRPVAPLKKAKGKKNAEAEEFSDIDDPTYLEALEEFGMHQTFLLLDMALVNQPAGKDFEDRVKVYKKLSAPALGTMIAGIQALMMNELTSDMREDLDAAEAEAAEAELSGL
jgi:hypothetical protein